MGQHWPRHESGLAPAHRIQSEPSHPSGSAVIQDYLQGSSYNRLEPARQLKRAFHLEARLYLTKGTDGRREVGIAEYAGWFSKNPGQLNGRIGRLLGIQVEGNIASAKAEILVEKDQARFVHLFLLKKLSGQSQIISKTATRESAPAHRRQVLLVVSSVDTMPGTALSAGNSISELIHACAELDSLVGITQALMSALGRKRTPRRGRGHWSRGNVRFRPIPDIAVSSRLLPA